MSDFCHDGWVIVLRTSRMDNRKAIIWSNCESWKCLIRAVMHLASVVVRRLSLIIWPVICHVFMLLQLSNTVFNIKIFTIPFPVLISLNWNKAQNFDSKMFYWNKQEVPWIWSILYRNLVNIKTNNNLECLLNWNKAQNFDSKILLEAAGSSLNLEYTLSKSCKYLNP